jgi:hypothetical protein
MADVQQIAARRSTPLFTNVHIRFTAPRTRTQQENMLDYRLDAGLIAPQSSNSFTQRESTSGNIATHTDSRVISPDGRNAAYFTQKGAYFIKPQI